MLKNVSYKSTSLENTKKIAIFFAKKFIETNNKTIVLLEGDLGSGKTTFVRYILNVLGISDTAFEGSPTFTIINQYKNNIFHIDLYRLTTKEDADNLGLFEILDTKGIFLIEWHRLLDIRTGILVKFKILNETERKITFIDKR